jgi:hypothetical protein
MKRLFLFSILAIVTPWALSAATTSPFPELSDGTAEHYYMIYSHRAIRVLKNNGVDSVIVSMKLDASNDSLKWKFVAVKRHANPDSSLLDTFKIVSKLNGEELVYKEYIHVGAGNGNYALNPTTDEYESVAQGAGAYEKINRFFTAATGGGSTFVFNYYKTDAGFIFQIWCVEAKQFVNMTNNTAPRHEICAYGVKDDSGNPFSAVNSIDDFGAMFEGAPVCSTSDNPQWYQLQFTRGSRAITSQGVNSNIKQAARIEEGDSTTQMFRMEGNYVDGFKVICMQDGLEMKHNSSANRIILVAAGEGDLFLFASTAVSDVWQLRRLDGGGFINETGGEACLYNYDRDAGNGIRFVDGSYNPYLGAPLLSTSSNPKWYYLLNSRANRVLKYRGIGERVYTEAIADGGVKQDSQLFRFEGVYKNGFKIISKMGGELKYNSDTARFFIQEAGDDFFKFEKSSNLTYGSDKWGVWHSESKGLNAHNAKVEEVTIYSLSDNGSVWGFIHVSRYFGVTVNDPAKGKLDKASGLYVDSSEITVVATPEPHFGLKSWTINSVETPATSDTLKLALNKDITLVANFAGNDTLLKTLTVTTTDGKNRLFPTFNRFASGQTARVPSSATGIRIEAEVQHELSTLVGDTGTHVLNGDVASYQITVTAENGAAKVYTITVHRAQAGASSDVSLTVTSDAWATVDNSDDLNRLVSIPADSSKVTIGASVAEGAVFVGDTGAFELVADRDSLLSITVMAASCDTSQTYLITAHRKSRVNLLKSLTITESGSASNLLSPTFSADRVSYSASISQSATGVTIAAIPQSTYATVTGSGDKALTGVADTFRITVTPEEGDAATYAIAISYLSNDATLKSIVITGSDNEAVALKPTFSPTVESYEARTASPTVTVAATANEENASVNPARKTITLTEGNNLYSIQVTAQDGASKTYTVIIALGEEQTAVETLALGSLTIYPNPVTGGVITIENGDLKAGEQVEVYSIAGSLVATFEASVGAQTVINVSRLPKGAYIVKLGKRAAKAVIN